RGLLPSHLLELEEEHHLHHGVVNANEVGEEVEVPGGEHEGEENLALAANALTTLAPPSLDPG
ncbi:hypothetical protein, partial [Serratia marcescens]|uniref:hypothetical protein n=1 Tax=Serratia marcescens TaxID=615 RepID=UPI001EF75AC5